MKKIFFALIFLCMISSCAFADVVINPDNFPDDNFRNYLSVSFDLDRNGSLDDGELSQIYVLELDSKDISSLKGIEHFMFLNGINCNNNNISEIDVTQNEHLVWINCNYNQIAEIDTTHNSELEGIAIEFNRLTSINVGANTSLEWLYAAGNQLSTLDVSNNEKLQTLTCYSNDLSALNVTNNRALQELYCLNNHISSLNVDNNTLLEVLQCQNNNLSSLNLRNNTSLREIHCNGNNIEAIDVSGITSLTFLWCYNNKLKTLNISGCTSLEGLGCQNNNIETLDVGMLTNLTELYCSYNNLSALDVSRLAKLEYLYCGRNHGITNLNVNNCTELKELHVYSCRLQTLDISNLTKLEYLGCHSNYGIRELNLRNNRALKRLYCQYNEIQNLDLSNNSNLEEVRCYANHLETINVNGANSLRILRCNTNSLTTLDVSGNVNLERLDVFRNHLTSINLAGNSALNSTNLKKQMIRSFDIDFDADNTSYPYSLNLNDYINSGSINNISDVKAYDGEEKEIAFTYSGGILRTSEYPVKVKYNYNTGRTGLNMDVTFAEITNTPEMTSLNNHVYRAFFTPMTWEDAKEYCETLDGHLAVISTQEELDAVNDMLSEISEIIYPTWSLSEDTHPFWVGCKYTNGVWQWLDGSELIWDVPYDNGDYLCAQSTEEFISWNNEDDNFFICEWDNVSADAAPLAEQFEIYSADPEAYYGDLENYGYVPAPEDLTHLDANLPVIADMTGTFFTADTLPSRFDLRTSNRITGIKDQGSYRTCWAHAALGSLESNYLTSHTNSQLDTSELHLAWFAYMDPRPGYSFPPNEKYDNVLNYGGYAGKAVSLLSRLAGPALETDLPYSNAGNVANLTKDKLPEDYSRPFRLKDAYVIGEITANKRNIIKTLIREYGAISISYCQDDSAEFSNSQYNSYYTSNEVTNHAINIIGWDDNFSRENFTTKPSSNGAWLARNSWGSNWRDNGCFWISYEQKIYNATLFIAGENYSGVKQYGHDELGSQSSIKIASNTTSSWSANIFQAQGDEILREIAFETKDNNTPYEIYINVFSSDLPVNPGTPKKLIASGVMSFAGYHALELSEEILLSKGNYFAVIVKVGKVSDYEYIIPVEGYGNVSTVNEGESYFASASAPGDSDWIDGKTINSGYNACIKAFTIPYVSIAISDTSLPSGKVSENYSYTFTASGTGPITWSASSLPSFLTLNGATISGTPNETGKYQVTITASNSKGADTRTFELEIKDVDSSGGGEGGNSGGGGCSMSSCFMGIALVMLMIKRKQQ